RPPRQNPPTPPRPDPSTAPPPAAGRTTQPPITPRGPRRPSSNEQEHEHYMATITADAVKDLRERTGAGMMDCKRALEDSSGDLDAAVLLLRERGLAAASKK